MRDVNLNFVIHNQLPSDSVLRASELARLRELDWHDGITECKTHAWAWPLYSLLKSKLLNVTLSTEPNRASLNIVTQNGVRKHHRFDPRHFFCLVLRADGMPFPYCPIEIVQNPRCAGKNRYFMPHLPQPGLIPRSALRSSVQNVAYVGESANDAIEKIGLRDLIHECGLKWLSLELGEWHNLRNVDIIVAVRSFDKSPHNHKPPTKLFNAWLAGIPFIGGWDSAYSSVGEPDVDFIRTHTAEGLRKALIALKTDPEYYRRIVLNGTRRAQQYSVESITNRWVHFIQEIAIPSYDKWRTGGVATAVYSYARYVAYRAIEDTPLMAAMRTWHYLNRNY